MKGIFTISAALFFVFSDAAKLRGPAGCLEGLHHHHMHHFSPMCQGKALTIPEEAIKISMECNNKTIAQFKSAKGPPTQEQRACEIVCRAQGAGLLDKDGKAVDQAAAQKIIEKIFPKEVSGKIVDTLVSCVEKNGKDLMIKENDCGSYTKLIDCIIITGREVCGMGPPQLF